MSLPPFFNKFAALASSSLSCSMCSSTSIYRRASNRRSCGSDCVVPTRTSHLDVVGSPARAAPARSASFASGSRQIQERTACGASKAVLAPIPAPTSSTSPLRNGRTHEDQYCFQCVACAKISSSCPTYGNSLIESEAEHNPPQSTHSRGWAEILSYFDSSSPKK